MPQTINISDSISHAGGLKKKYQHVFIAHSLKPTNKNAIPFVASPPIWPAFIILFAFVLLVYLRVTYVRKISTLLKSFFTLQACRQLEREDYRLTRRTSVILSFIYLIIVSVFFYQYNFHFRFVKLRFEPIVQFQLIFLFFCIFCLIKILINSLLGFILLANKQAQEYNFSIFLNSQAIGLFLLPVVVCAQYLNFLLEFNLFFGLGIILFFYVLRLIKGVQIVLESRKASLFHLFLYICTLEILPLVVLATFLLRLTA